MYVIVENAGYEHERDIAKFISYRQAVRYVRANYASDEEQELHLAIAKEVNGAKTYEF